MFDNEEDIFRKLNLNPKEKEVGDKVFVSFQPFMLLISVDYIYLSIYISKIRLCLLLGLTGCEVLFMFQLCYIKKLN